MIVGLGNPGQRYEWTRHNVGFMVVQAMAGAHDAGPPSRKFNCLLTSGTVGEHRVVWVQPQTFMNDSGIAVGQVARFYELDLADCMVVCDTLDLPVGTIRVRGRGSAGGQRGLVSVESHLGSRDYPRLRIGIGRPARQDPIKYVLGRFKSAERPVIKEAVIEATRALEVWVRQGMNACMNEFN